LKDAFDVSFDDISAVTGLSGRPGLGAPRPERLWNSCPHDRGSAGQAAIEAVIPHRYPMLLTTR
jgi:hypothetical protein